jgi:2-dehydro-3-deoxyphosphogluconate aldolase/(4S)-4-hydroxy-2-oxoglutarate aldolase
MADKLQILQTVHETGVIAVIRADSAENLLQAAQALLEGGVFCIEFTLTTPGSLDMIRSCSEQLGRQACIGAGTVLDAETARMAILAGAQFVVSPAFDADTVRLCRAYDTLVIPGAFTPTEVLQAWKNGADIVKIFPAGVGGPALVKDLKGPFPQIKMVPSGGVDFQTAADFIRNGAFALGAGSSLVSSGLLASGRFAQITENARRFVEIVRLARG